jgi:hypothetical protein
MNFQEEYLLQIQLNIELEKLFLEMSGLKNIKGELEIDDKWNLVKLRLMIM